MVKGLIMFYLLFVFVISVFGVSLVSYVELFILLCINIVLVKDKYIENEYFIIIKLLCSY